MSLCCGVFYRLGNIFFGDIRCGSGSAVGPIEVDDICAGIVAANSDHIHICWSGDFDRNKHIGVN